MVAMSDFSTFSQMTCQAVRSCLQSQRRAGETYWDAVVVLLANALRLGLALLEGVLVLELGSHFAGVVGGLLLGHVMNRDLGRWCAQAASVGGFGRGWVYKVLGESRWAAVRDVNVGSRGAGRAGHVRTGAV